MQSHDRSWFVPFLVLPLLLGACSSEDSSVNSSSTGGPGAGTADSTDQEFTENFDSGSPGARWGCSLQGLSGYFCNWEINKAGSLDPAARSSRAQSTSTTVEAGIENYVFQSPDPLALEPGRRTSCDRFTAKFDTAGTFAFNYLINTLGPIGFQDGNNLEVNIWKNTVELLPGFDEEVVVGSELYLEVIKQSGSASSRSITPLPPGHYDFEFCYARNRSDTVGPDFVHLDNIQTCEGTGCAGTVPEVARCHIDQGATVVPDLDAVPGQTFTVARAPGPTIRYYIIIDVDFLEFVSAGFDLRSDPDLAVFKSEIDGILTTTLVDGTTCDVDQRKSVFIEMTAQEIFFFLAGTGVLERAFDALKSALWSFVTSDSELKSILFGSGVPQDILNDFLKDTASSIQDALIPCKPYVTCNGDGGDPLGVIGGGGGV